MTVLPAQEAKRCADEYARRGRRAGAPALAESIKRFELLLVRFAGPKGCVVFEGRAVKSVADVKTMQQNRVFR
jgi:hypothetical protein